MDLFDLPSEAFIEPSVALPSVIARADSVPAFAPASFASVLRGDSPASVYDARLNNPAEFAPGSLLRARRFWESVIIPSDHAYRQFALDTLGDVRPCTLFKHFKGTFEGVDYDDPLPPPRAFHNYGLDQLVSTGQSARDWIADELRSRLRSGTVRRWGSDPYDACIGDTPIVVNPLSVEPSKPRLITAMCYVNCWAVSHSFFPGLLNYPTEVPGLFGRRPMFTGIDFKSHYGHYSLHVSTQPYFGFRFDLGDGPEYFVLTAGGFGFALWCFIANLHRYLLMRFCWRHGVCSLGFFDDCLLGPRRLRVAPDRDWTMPLRCHESVYIFLMVAGACGYYVSFRKCDFFPSWELK